MDYEKAYKEALEKAKDYHKQLIDEDNSEWASEIEKIFPELAESEDERIRKWLIGYFQQYKIDGMDVVYTSGFKADDIIAWLEKQGEKEAANKIEPKFKVGQSELTEFEDAVKDMMNAYRDAIGDNDVTTEEVKKHATYLLSLIPHKSTVWSEDDEKIRRELMKNLRDGAEGYMPAGNAKDYTRWLSWLEKQSEPKWGEEDEKLLQHCCGAVAAADYYTLEDKEEMENWLKSLKQRMEE